MVKKMTFKQFLFILPLLIFIGVFSIYPIVTSFMYTFFDYRINDQTANSFYLSERFNGELFYEDCDYINYFLDDDKTLMSEEDQKAVEEIQATVSSVMSEYENAKGTEKISSDKKDELVAFKEKLRTDITALYDKYPDVDVTVFYIDVRTPGKNFDEFYRRAVEEFGVHYIKGMVGKVSEEDGVLKVQASDLLANSQIHMDADMVVLAAAIEPDESARPLATMLTASMDTNDFFTEAHAKLRPVESPTAGVFLSGTCQGPKDIPETVSQASAAAAKVIGLLAKDHLLCNPCVSHSNELLCNGCSTCANVCPYGAIDYVTKEINDHGIRETRRVAVVNEAVCQGCGACTVTCPSGAMDLKGFANRQIMAEVDAICR